MVALRSSLAEAAASGVRQREPDLAISRGEAEALLMLEHMQSGSSSGLIACVVADRLVAEEPAGILTAEKIAWLMRVAAPGGRVESAVAFAVIVETIERASQGAEPLAVFAIDELRTAIIRGEGAAIGPRRHFSRVIDDEDVALLHRILAAAGGREGQPLTRGEADALFDLRDAARADDEALFNRLFSRAIVNHVVAASGHVPAPRQAMLASDGALDGEVRLDAEPAAWLIGCARRCRQPMPVIFDHLLNGTVPAMPGLMRNLVDSAV